MNNTENIKKKHHFVFQAYLSKWKDTNNAIWALRDRKKLFATGTEGIAFKNSFYTIKEINSEEQKLLDCYLATMEPLVREQMEIFIQAYLIPIQNKKLIDKMKKDAINKFGSEKCIPADIEENIKQCEHIISVQKNNTMEDFYCDIEGELVEYFRAIDKKGIDFYYTLDKNKQFEFLYDICIQYFRTMPLKERWIQKFGNSIKTLDFTKVKIDINKVNLDNVAPFFFWHIQTLTAYALMSKNATVTLLHNKTSTPFITSDQPIINIKCDYSNDLLQTTDLTFYYPISPSKALLINGEYSEKEHVTTEKEVDEYNSAMAKASSKFIVTNMKKMLEQFRKE